MSIFQASLSTKPRRLLRRQEHRALIGSLIATDALVVALSFTIAYLVRFELGLTVVSDGTIKPMFYSLIGLALVPGFLAMFNIYGLYQLEHLLGGTNEYARLFNAVAAGTLLIIFINFIQPDFVVARGWLLMSWALMSSLGLLGRFAMRRWVYMQRRHGRFLDRTLVVGANPEGLSVAAQLAEARTSGSQIIGFVDDYLPTGNEPLPNMPVLGSSAMFANLVESHQIDTVVIANTAITRERLLSVYGSLDALQDVEVRLASGLFEMLTTGVRVREEGFVPLVVLNKTRITGLHYVLKTALDYLLALGALTVFLPMFIVLYLMVKRDSPGPVIYRRRVVGQGKKEFDAFKFRTMYIDGDARLSPEDRAELASYGKLKDDPRITRMGHFLRKFSLDELPQLFNVLRGEMSLIGPRMLTTPELEKFGKWQHNLATVKPGLTGLWQVSGRSDLSYEDRVRLDMHYIRYHTIWLDLLILFRTIPALLTGRGAY